MLGEGEEKILTGHGIVSAAECKPVRVRYRVVVEREWDGALTARGSIHGNPAGLLPIWLEPDAVLRLKTGVRLDISVTDLINTMAEFESTGMVSDNLLSPTSRSRRSPRR
ncbi:hypothetical protein CTI14_01550 [Methylobacterium radiotolerans]|nr:hypothetical protein CTI14_01550 [Methylobacterium radiotolerans]